MSQLVTAIGEHSEAGRKAINQDFVGAYVPPEPLLSTKGVCAAIADGISSSTVSQIASESAVRSFLDDYYCTSDAWAVRTSAERVLTATNNWLYSQTRNSEYRYELDRGFVCTFSAAIFKGHRAHLLHVGDARIYRLNDTGLTRLTQDHRLQGPGERSQLTRALGISSHLEIDYAATDVAVGDTFLLATDGVHEFVDEACLRRALTTHADDLNQAARAIAQAASEAGSEDNLSVVLVRVEQLPVAADASQLLTDQTELPLPPLLEPGQKFDGYDIIRALHESHRSHVYLAREQDSGVEVALKIPAMDLRSDARAVDRFLMEEWIIRRVRHDHVVKLAERKAKPQFAYIALEYLNGQSLAQWMRDNPRPDVETVRGLVEQIAAGLQAFHRQDMLHQDLRPENVLVDGNGTVKLIDFGGVRVAGVDELATLNPNDQILGTVQYTAPEYFLGEAPTTASDIFSLGVITYQMLCGRLPYGAKLARARTRAEQRRIEYDSVLSEDRAIPAWLDETLKKAVHRDPTRRYALLSEFVYDLRHPNAAFLRQSARPLLERDPARFWRGVSALLLIIIVVLLASRG